MTEHSDFPAIMLSSYRTFHISKKWTKFPRNIRFASLENDLFSNLLVKNHKDALKSCWNRRKRRKVRKAIEWKANTLHHESSSKAYLRDIFMNLIWSCVCITWCDACCSWWLIGCAKRTPAYKWFWWPCICGSWGAWKHWKVAWEDIAKRSFRSLFLAAAWLSVFVFCGQKFQHKLCNNFNSHYIYFNLRQKIIVLSPFTVDISCI